MNDATCEMIDLVFDLHGESLPAVYHFALWEALLKHVPQLAEHEHVSVLPLKVSEHGGQILLPKRVKLALRMPLQMIAQASRLGGAQLDVSGNSLALGEAKQRTLQPYSTLHAKLTAGADDEIQFLQAVETHFSLLNISAKMICGRRNILSDGIQSISGYSLVVHDLKPESSLRLQSVGMGEWKKFGCGIFMPYKVISDLE